MLIAVTMGYALAVLFGVCGIVQVCVTVSGMEMGMGAGVFASQLMLSAWPLAVCGLILLLIQILEQLDKLRIQQLQSSAFPAPAQPGKVPETVGREKTIATIAPHKKDAPRQFFKADPTPAPPVVKTEELPLQKPGEPAPESKPAPATPPAAEKKDEENLHFFRMN